MFGDPRLPPRFWLRVKVESDGTGCWLWTGRVRPNGYGSCSVRGEANAHRSAYAALVGPIPAGLTIDHLCRVRRCVNPAHMEPVTHLENVRRAAAFVDRSVKEFCVRGHRVPDVGHLRLRDGRWRCAECHRENSRSTAARARARREQPEAVSP